ISSVLFSFLAESYRGALNRNNLLEFIYTLIHVLAVTFFTAIYLFIANLGVMRNMQLLLLTLLFYFFLNFITRVMLKEIIHIRNKKVVVRSLIIVTTKDLVDRVIDNIKNNNYEGFKITGISVIDSDMIGEKIDNIPVVANLDNLMTYICREWVDEVFLNIPSTSTIVDEIVDDFVSMGISVHMRVMHSSELKSNQFIEKIGRYTVVTTSMNTISLKDMAVKRIVDILAGIVGCIITGVLYLILAPLIYIKSPGPIFFTQIRIGRNGRKFKIYKFRSMYMDAEERKKSLMDKNEIKDGMMFKMEYDPRIIGSEKGPKKGIGNIIRRLSLDEWPQFFNILKGDMSLIGTRPPTLDEWEKYENHHRVRLAMKPGLTGMWQVSGRSSIKDFEDVVKLDKEYITKWSLLLDIKIIFKTILVVLKGDGAS
ncbi:MAG: sugar transferase, partial [Clostridia bacterium]